MSANKFNTFAQYVINLLNYYQTFYKNKQIKRCIFNNLNTFAKKIFSNIYFFQVFGNDILIALISMPSSYY